MRLSLLAGLSLVCSFILSCSGIVAEPAGQVAAEVDFARYEVIEKFRADVLMRMNKPTWICPVDPWRWRVTDGWGAGRGHHGLDIAVKWGKKAYAIGAGKVIFSGWDWTYGNLVKIRFDDGGDVGWYGHLSSRKVKKGKRVEAGDVIGLVGNTGHSFGPHLHLGIERGGEFIDPWPWLKKRISREEWHRRVVW